MFIISMKGFLLTRAAALPSRKCGNAHQVEKASMRPSTVCTANTPFLEPVQDPKNGTSQYSPSSPNMSYSLNSLKGGCIGNKIGDYYRAYEGGY